MTLHLANKGMLPVAAPGEVGTSAASGKLATYDSNGLLVGGGSGVVSALSSGSALYGPYAVHPVTRWMGCAAAVNSKIYVFGGATGSTASNVVKEFDPATNTWTSKTAQPASTGLVRNCAVAYNGLIYHFGGAVSSAANSTAMYSYNPATDTWSAALAAMPTARQGVMGVECGGKIYAIGGTTTLSASNVVNEPSTPTLSTLNSQYDPVGNTWTAKAVIPAGVFCAAIGTINGKIYVAGGRVASNNLTTAVYEYDPVGDSWTAKASMPVGVANAGYAVVDNKLFVFNGTTTSGGNAVNTCYSYDPATDTWRTEDAASPVTATTGLRYPMAAVVDDAIFRIGGGDTSAVSYDYTHLFVPGVMTTATSNGVLVARHGNVYNETAKQQSTAVGFTTGDKICSGRTWNPTAVVSAMKV